MRSFLHRHAWRRLPQTWRRSALFTATRLLAPRPTPGSQAAHPIIVAGALRAASGLGQSARLCHDALLASGFPVFGIDLTSALMQPEDYPAFVFADGTRIDGAGTLILHVNSPLIPLAMLRLGRRVVRMKRIIGYWAWELPQVPSDWQHGIPFVTEIWVPTRFTADAIEPISGNRSVHIIPHPVAHQEPVKSHGKRNIDHPFTALTFFNVASSFVRKNPCAAINAFKKAFGSDPTARLIVKSSNLSSIPGAAHLIEAACAGAPNITIIDRIMSLSEIDALYADADVVVSLHRSEGFGLVIAEAMMRGLPVVATNWSGNVDFLSEATGAPIGYQLVPAEDPQFTYQHPQMHWAEADTEEAAEALRRLRTEPRLRRQLGLAASQFAALNWSAAAYSEIVRFHLSPGEPASDSSKGAI